jgi:hypothetical protein
MDTLTSYAAEFPFGSFWSRDLANGTIPPRPGKLTRRAPPCRLPLVHSAQVKLIWPFGPQAKLLANW